MKKFFTMMFISLMLGMVFTACGDEKDEPNVPETNNLESVHQSATDRYYVFDIDMTKGTGTIYMYNIIFAEGAPSMNLRVEVPVSLSSDGNSYVMTGTGLVAARKTGDTWTPMPGDKYHLNNLSCTVNPKAKTYSISFDAHGGQFSDTGKLQ